ncbi:MAG: hypothetical protein ACTSV3_06080 [Candidatus Thorarchaeota archaeon]
MGGGIHIIAGAAAGIVGPALILAYFRTGVLAMFTAANYAENAGSIPKEVSLHFWGTWSSSHRYPSSGISSPNASSTTACHG